VETNVRWGVRWEEGEGGGKEKRGERREGEMNSTIDILKKLIKRGISNKSTQPHRLPIIRIISPPIPLFLSLINNRNPIIQDIPRTHGLEQGIVLGVIRHSGDIVGLGEGS
jgi:hypothetical protein